MTPTFLESTYPISFRKDDAKSLGQHLKHRHCVELIGMKRVGISNFLRFFLTHQEIIPHYISQKESHLFISVDLNDLVEMKLFSFWILVFKRVVDSLERLPNHDKLKKKVA